MSGVLFVLRLKVVSSGATFRQSDAGCNYDDVWPTSWIGESRAEVSTPMTKRAMFEEPCPKRLRGVPHYSIGGEGIKPEGEKKLCLTRYTRGTKLKYENSMTANGT